MTGGSMDVTQHGERRTYRRGCRCLVCRVANAQYEAARRQARADGKPRLGSVVPAHKTHIAMKLLRVEGFTHQGVADLLGWGHAYARTRRRARVTLRTQLRVLRLYRERCLVAPEAAN